MYRFKTSYFYNEWFESLISQKKLLSRFSLFMPKIYYNLLLRDDERIAISLDGSIEGYKDTYEDLMRLVKEKKSLMLFPVRYNGKAIYLFKYENGRYILAGRERTEEECIDFCKGLEFEYALIENIGDSKDLMSFSGLYRNIVNVIVHNKNNEGEHITELTDAFLTYTEHDPKTYNLINPDDGTVYFKKGAYIIPNWNDIVSVLKDISKYMSIFEILQFKFVVTENGLKILKVSPFVETPDNYVFSTATTDFINKRSASLDDPSKQFADKLSTRKTFYEKWNKIAKEKHRSGMRPYMASFWAQELEADESDPTISEESKQWAHERGFFGYRINELGLTEDNYRNYVSDYDYFWVNRINGDYQIWVENKLAIRYALDNVSHTLPNHYYCISKINGNERILPLPDLPSGMKCTYSDLLKLLQEKGKLAVKNSYGSHGTGFNVIEYKDSSYLLNGVEINKSLMLDQLFHEEANYLITEYVVAHEWVNNFYPNSLNTIRVNAMQLTNDDPIIGACFMRIGHSSGGYTDNLNNDSGGIAVSIDKTHGDLMNPEFKRGNHYETCRIHPDTKQPIQGVVPFWDKIIDEVKSICKGLPQLQYFGFDIAVTEDSFKIIEVNVFPDYTKFLVTDTDTQDFLKKAVVKKFKKHYIDLPEQYRQTNTVSGSKYKYKFSVIMPIYNLEQYLETALDSVINQTLGFKENIQVVLVDDGSTDSCAEICKNYQERFPENILYIYKENGGVSSSRNVGLNYSQGKYLTFFDGDDIWSKTAFARVWDFIESCDNDIDVIACRRKFFEGRNGYLGNDFRFSKGTRIVDIEKEPHCFHVDVNASFIKSDCAKVLRFDETLTLGEDSLYVNHIILEKKKYGLVKDSLLYFRKRIDNSSMTQTLDKGENLSIYTDTLLKYYEHFYKYSEERFGEVIPYIQYLIMDAVRYRLAMPIHSNISRETRDDYKHRLIQLCKQTSLEVLLTLRNGSIGARTNLIRLAYPDMYKHDLIVDGKKVLINNKAIGELNVNAALSIMSCRFTSEKALHIEGNILVPSFIDKPSVYLSTDDDNTVIIKAALEKSSKGNYMAIDDTAFYQRYNLSATIDLADINISAKQVLYFYIDTDTAPAKLYANYIGSQNDNDFIKAGKVVL